MAINQFAGVKAETSLVPSAPSLKKSDKISINITKWMETFQIFAAVYSEKSPQGNGGLMTCT